MTSSIEANYTAEARSIQAAAAARRTHVVKLAERELFTRLQFPRPLQSARVRLRRWRQNSGETEEEVEVGQSSRPSQPCGTVEGGYNHFYKDVLFLLGASQTTVQTWHPPLMAGEFIYPPDNWLFESSGVLQLVVAYFPPLCTYRIADARGRI